ncbi:protein O-GlcNAcase [Mycoplasmopsis cynos]|nr:protein O-GlcNAcase [Mycoplasmopsis cynos]
MNWPCSDNSKNHLILGGYREFLHKNVDPKKVQGIVLNPMQQSEPSKVALFGAAIILEIFEKMMHTLIKHIVMHLIMLLIIHIKKQLNQKHLEI